MFAGLVATASSRSSSHGRETASSPTVSEAEEGEGEAPDTYGEASNAYAQAFFSSPAHTHASSPRTDGRRLASEEFQSPYSMATHPSPSTGNRRSRHFVAAQSDDSPAALRSWGTPSMYDDDRGGGEVGVAAMYRLEDEEEGEAEKTPLPPFPASAAATYNTHASPPKTSLEALADERTSSSSASSCSAENAALGLPLDDPPLHAAPGTGRALNAPVAVQRLAVPSQPLVASTLPLSPVERQRVPAAVSADSLSPITPPLAAAPLSPLTPSSASDIGSNTSRDEGRRSEGRRSGTREGREVPHDGATTAGADEYASSSASSSSPVSYRSATPCAPPPDSPPDSAMKRPPGAVVVVSEPPPPAAQTDEVVDYVSSAAAAPADALAFEVAYLEEGHRVQLQTQETEERRCLFRAHRAVLTVYRMWAAEAEDAARGRGDIVLRVGWDGAAAAPPVVVEAVVHRIADRAEPAASVSDGVAPDGVERSGSAASATAADRVQSFLSTSIESARERRSGSAKATTSEAAAVGAAVVPPRTLTPTIAYSGDLHWEERRALPSAVPHTPPPPSTSAAAASASSPAASRVLDYSSLLMADTRGPADTSLSNAGGRWAQRDSQRQPPPPSSASSSRLFSPWRWDRSDQRSPPQSRRATAAAAAGEAAGVRPSFVPHGTDGATPRLSDTPLIPHIRRTSSLTSHTAAGAAAAAVGGSGDTTWDREGTRRAGEAAAVRRSPASLLSDTYLSVTGYGGREERGGRSCFSPFSYSRGGQPSPALVRSPRVAANEGAADARPRRRTPPWNRSPNLRSTAAACRDPSLLHEEAAGVPLGPSATTTTNTASPPSSALGFVPNNAFYQRQRAATFTTPSSIPLEAEALYARGLSALSPAVHHAAPSEASKSERRRRQERLSSYVQYKRFFDTEYGASGALESQMHTQRAAVPSSSRTSARPESVWRGTNTTGAADRQTPSQAPVSAATTLRYAARDTNDFASTPTTTADDSVRRTSAGPSRRWSPDALPRRAVPHPTMLHHFPSNSTVGEATQLPTPSLAAVERYSSGVYVDVGAARLARLCTLEQLCRAEVQRRWMEDQNTLLHRFVMEGTAALQRGRGRRVSAGASTGPALPGQLPHHAAAQKRVVEGACAWTFIPNEMD